MCKMQYVIGLAGLTSWTDQMDRPAVRIFEDFSFSLYIVAASESDEGLVYFHLYFFVFNTPLPQWQNTNYPGQVQL